MAINDFCRLPKSVFSFAELFVYNGQYICNALKFYFALCVDACATNPCKNGGTCVNDNGEYFCLCRRGFAGCNCERSKPYYVSVTMSNNYYTLGLYNADFNTLKDSNNYKDQKDPIHSQTISTNHHTTQCRARQAMLLLWHEVSLLKTVTAVQLNRSIHQYVKYNDKNTVKHSKSQ